MKNRNFTKIDENVTLSELKEEADQLKNRIDTVKKERRHMYVQCNQIIIFIKFINNLMVILTMLSNFFDFDQQYKAMISHMIFSVINDRIENNGIEKTIIEDIKKYCTTVVSEEQEDIKQKYWELLLTAVNIFHEEIVLTMENEKKGK